MLIRDVIQRPGVPIEEYLALSALSGGALHTMRRSPAHFRAAQDADLRGDSRDTAAMALGRLIHLAVLEPGKFRTETGWASPADGKTAFQCANALDACPEARAFLHHPAAAHEVTLTWNAGEGGYPMKGRPDVIGPDWIADLKTTTDAEEGPFSRACNQLGHALKLTLYGDVLTALTGREYHRVLVVVETGRGCGVKLYPVDTDIRDYWQCEYERAFEVYETCRRTERWPGYAVWGELRLPRRSE